MTWIRLLACSLLWIPAYAIMAVLWLLGIPIVLGLGLARAARLAPAPLTDGTLTFQWKPRWAWLWSNSEDHVDGPSRPQTSPSTIRWVRKTLMWPFWRRAFSWSALRNSVANERMLYRPSPSMWFGDGLWVGNSAHPHEDWKLGARTIKYDPASGRFFADGPRYLWCFARRGLRSGLWIRRVRDPRNYALGYVEIRLGWKLVPGPAREAERYAGLGLQFHRRGAA